MSILVVDDSRRIAQALARQLYDMGHRVIAATSDVEAIRLLRSRNFDILISDLILGMDQNGVYVLKKAHELQPYMKRVLMSGFVTRRDLMDAQRNDLCDAYLQKPWTQELLLDAIR